VSGIWPPDVGGPAVHAPELAGFLQARGHDVVVVTTADDEPAAAPYEVRWISRRTPPGLRHLRAAAEVARAARGADLVYAVGMIGRSGLATTLVRRPVVVRLTADPAYERSLRLGWASGSLADFRNERGVRVGLLRALRDAPLRRAAAIVSPSGSLAELAASWGVDPARVTLVPNPVAVPALDDRDELRRRHGLEGPSLVFAGRFVPQKSLDVGLEALGLTEGVTLVLAGDGPERPGLEALAGRLGLGDRARFLGARPRQTVFELLRAADAALLPSGWENFPHAVVEALAVGTPVLATRVGGVPEVVEDGENGLLVAPGDPVALADAIRRFFSDGALRGRLRAAAAASVAAYSPEKAFGRLEALLEDAADDRRRRSLSARRTARPSA
jgi:glycosyltransferase involved in cell wall biosynthesis